MKKTIYIVIGIFLFSFYSCSEDWLNVEPTKSIPDSKAFSTESSFNAAVIGVYYSLQSHNGFGNYAIESSDIRGEDMILKSRNNWGRFRDLYNYSYIPTASTGNSVYLNMYQVIEGCNSILDADTKGKISIKEDLKNPLLAEVKALRALCYFELVRLFCQPYQKNNGASPGIPLKTDPEVSILKGRGTVKEVYDLILQDLEFATKYLKVSPVKDRINVTFAQGLLARVYMTMGNNDKAIEYADLAIASAPTLSPDFYSSGVSQDNPSVIFSLDYTPSTFSGYLSYVSFHDYGWQDSGGYGTIGATEEFFKEYSDSDLRRSWFINRWVYENKLPYRSYSTWTALQNKLESGDKNTYDLFVSNGLLPGGLWDDSINRVSDENIEKLRVQMFDNAFYETISMYGKFPRVDAIRATSNEPTTSVGTANLGNVPMMRTPELYLIVAECSAMKGDFGKAKSYLEKVQNNAKAQVFNGSNSDLLEAIRLERRKELIGEGFRIFDIMRQGKVINRTNYWGPTQNSTIDPNKENSKVYLPIPQKEINSNPNISEEDQNPAY